MSQPAVFKNPKVSVITPVYNSSKYLVATISSVIAQTFSDWELLLVDDKSTDHSIRVAESFCKQDKRIRLLTHSTNLGAAAARNTALAVAQGEYLACLDSDDLFDKDKLTTQIKYMEDHDLPFSYSAYRVIDEQDQPAGRFIPPLKINYSALLKSNVIGCLTAVWHQSLTETMEKPILQVGINVPEDYVLWLRILKKIDYAYCVTNEVGAPRCLASYRVHRGAFSASKTKVARNQWRVYREVEKLDG